MRTTVLALLGCFASASLVAVSAHAFDDLEAHRGGRGLWPENTLVSFGGALGLGVDTLELDLGVTRDGQVVVSHERGLNPVLARDASGRYVEAPGTPFVKLTLAEVKRYDVGQIRPGSAYAQQFPAQKPVPGTTIPTLAEVFALVRRSGNSHVRLNIETKIDPRHPEDTLDPEHFVRVLLDLLEREKMTDRVLVQSFDWRTLQLVQRAAPRIPTVYLTTQSGDSANVQKSGKSDWTAGFDPERYGGSVPAAIKAAGGAVWSPNHADIDAADIAQAHALGLRVVAWTVNDEASMSRLIDQGVDGLISDRPDLLRRVVQEKHLPLPAATPVR